MEGTPPRQAARLAALAAATEPGERVRALELRCSLARGAGDELCDVDPGLWLADGAPDAPASSFVEYADGVQVDSGRPASSGRRAARRAPSSSSTKDGLLAEPYEPSV